MLLCHDVHDVETLMIFSATLLVFLSILVFPRGPLSRKFELGVTLLLSLAYTMPAFSEGVLLANRLVNKKWTFILFYVVITVDVDVAVHFLLYYRVDQRLAFVMVHCQRQAKRLFLMLKPGLLLFHQLFILVNQFFSPVRCAILGMLCLGG